MYVKDSGRTMHHEKKVLSDLPRGGVKTQGPCLRHHTFLSPLHLKQLTKLG